MSAFSRLTKRSSTAIDRHLSNCVVTIGNTLGVAPLLRAPVSKQAVVQADKNLSFRGSFESPFVVDVDREGYEITVDIENPVPLTNTQNLSLLRRDDRLTIRADRESPTVQTVYAITSVQPDGQWRVLLHLSLLGPLCESAEEFDGFPLDFPIVLGGRTYNECINLNGGAAFMNEGVLLR